MGGTGAPIDDGNGGACFGEGFDDFETDATVAAFACQIGRGAVVEGDYRMGWY